MITFVDRRGRQQTVALHLKCAPIYEESGNLRVEDEAPAPEPEAAAGSSEEDDADGWQFNREGDDAP
jgi:hypothetical protein